MKVHREDPTRGHVCGRQAGIGKGAEDHVCCNKTWKGVTCIICLKKRPK